MNIDLNIYRLYCNGISLFVYSTVQDYYFGIVFHLTNISLENAGQTEILHSFVVKILPTGQTFNQLVNRSTATNSTIFGIQLLEIGQQNPTVSGALI